MKRVRVILTVVLLGLLGAAVTYYASLQAAPAAGYQPPPVSTLLIGRPDPPTPVKKLSDHLYTVGPLKVVHVWGTPREMGLQCGKAIGADFKAAYELYMHQHVEVDGHFALDYQRRCAAAMAKHIPAEYVEEMRAVAEGAGVPYEQILLLHTHADMVHFGHEWGKVTDGRQRTAEGRGDRRQGTAFAALPLDSELGTRNPELPLSSCSNFVAFGPATRDGKVYHGRNLDWTIKTGVQQYAVLYLAEPKGAVPFAILTYAGAIGGVTGMNAEGLTFGEMTSSTADETLDGLPLFLTCRHILDSCRNLNQVEQFVKTYPDTTGWNFVIADGKARDARAFEVDAKHRVVFRPNDPTESDPPISWPIPNALRRTNHPISHTVQRAAMVRAKLDNEALARVALPSMDTWQRYACLGQWIADDYYGKIDDRIARAMLQTPPVAAGNNLQSAVFDATDRVMWLADASEKEPAYSQQYVRIDLKEWIGKRG